MGNHTIRRDGGPRRRNNGPTAKLTKDAIDRLNAQREDVAFARGTRENVRQPSAPRLEFVDDPGVAIEEPTVQMLESRQTSTIQGMPPIDRPPAPPLELVDRKHRLPDAHLVQPADSRLLVYALVALVCASAAFAIWAMTR